MPFRCLLAEKPAGAGFSRGARDRRSRMAPDKKKDDVFYGILGLRFQETNHSPRKNTNGFPPTAGGTPESAQRKYWTGTRPSPQSLEKNRDGQGSDPKRNPAIPRPEASASKADALRVGQKRDVTADEEAGGGRAAASASAAGIPDQGQGADARERKGRGGYVRVWTTDDAHFLQCWPSCARIAEELEVSERTVKCRVSDLIQQGILHARRERRRDGPLERRFLTLCPGILPSKSSKSLGATKPEFSHPRSSTEAHAVESFLCSSVLLGGDAFLDAFRIYGFSRRSKPCAEPTEKLQISLKSELISGKKIEKVTIVTRALKSGADSQISSILPLGSRCILHEPWSG